MLKKYLFIDRDGTLIKEPPDQQIDSYEKFALLEGVVAALQSLQQAGYILVMVSNQDGLGSETYPLEKFNSIQKLLLDILSSQGIEFSEILICPHRTQDACSCRKPQTQLVKKYLSSNDMDRSRSYVIGDRATDIELAERMGVQGLLLDPKTLTWPMITNQILKNPRTARVQRSTNETQIDLQVNLDGLGTSKIHSGHAFFDHMLEQLSRHGKFDLQLQAKGDTHVDDHHLVEDTALALGQALRQALQDKRGITRYGFWLPMDEASTRVTLDLSGRAHFHMDAHFPRESVGGLATEMVPHFFRSLADSLAMSLHIDTRGENTHHIVESMFKAVGRSLQMAFAKDDQTLIPSTKGIL